MNILIARLERKKAKKKIQINKRGKGGKVEVFFFFVCGRYGAIRFSTLDTLKGCHLLFATVTLNLTGR
jgi:hypothetical protein